MPFATTARIDDGSCSHLHSRQGVRVRNAVRATSSPGLAADLSAIRRYIWLPVLAVVVAVGAALVAGALTPSSSEARFRMNVLVDALPPLFGPPALPSPFDY